MDRGSMLESRCQTDRERDPDSRRMWQVLDNLFAFVGVLGVDGTILEANRAPLERAGLHRRQVIGRKFWDTHWWSHDPAVRERLRQAVWRAAAGETVRYDTEILGAGGARIAIDFQLAPLRGPNGEVVELIPSAVDITDRRRIEQALLENEKMLRLALRGAKAGAWVRDLDTATVRCDRGFEEIFGLAAGAFAGTHAALLSLIHPADRATFSEAIERAIATRSDYQVEVRFRHSSGEWRWLEGRGRVDCDERGRPRRVHGIGFDITDRKTTELAVQHMSRILQMLNGINAAAMRIAHRDDLLRDVCRLAVEKGGYAGSVVTLLDAATGLVTPVAWETCNGAFMGEWVTRVAQRHELDQTLAGRVLRTGEVFVSNAIDRLEPALISREELLREEYTGIVSLPLLVDGTPFGALTLTTKDPVGITSAEIPLLREVAANLSFALQYLQKDAEVRFVSHFDVSTGLARRALFCERLSGRLQSPAAPEREFAVVVLDLVRLNAVNDTMGYHVGDLLLRHTADRLTRHVGDSANVAYFGGGTFALLLERQRNGFEDMTSSVHHRIDRMFAEPFRIEGHEFTVSVRFGLARQGEHGERAEELVQYAETVLKEAKEVGEKYLHRRLHVTSDLAARLELEHRLRLALDLGQFVLHYQPKIGMVSGRIEGVEALLRWNDPERGLVPPGVFLPLLDSTGLIVQVGEWVLRRAAEDARIWRNLGLPPMRVAVNVSPLQLRRRDFADQFLDIAAPIATGGRGLEIEVTEGAFQDDASLAMQSLQRLHTAGVHIAIDDFGTGYSSLSRLSSLPVDTLKIDRSFVMQLPGDARAEALVSMIVGLTRTFGMQTVAEGVETQAQFQCLREMGCDYSQGYLHQKPMAREALEALLCSGRDVPRDHEAHARALRRRLRRPRVVAPCL